MKLSGIIVLCLLVALLIVGCTPTEQSVLNVPENSAYENEVVGQNAVNVPENGTYENEASGQNRANNICEESGVTVCPLQTHKLPINEDGFIEVIVPENLLGGDSAETFAQDFLDSLGRSGTRVPITGVLANTDGSATMLLTEEQLVQNRHNMRNFARAHEHHNLPSIKDIIFIDDEMLTEITVLVDAGIFAQNLFDRTVSNVVLVMFVGQYQILHGVAPDEWHVTITVKDYETGEIVSITEFPHDDMFTIHIGND